LSNGVLFVLLYYSCRETLIELERAVLVLVKRTWRSGLAGDVRIHSLILIHRSIGALGKSI